MLETTIIGVDLAKRVFQLHGVRADGSTSFRKKLSRVQFLSFLREQPRCIVAMEACATAHGWGREIEKLGHAVRLIPPVYVKPFGKRQKNDTADAEEIAEAASRPTMRFVAVKTEAQQASAMLFRTREMFVGQRTQSINALRGHLAEHGLVAPQGSANIKRLADALEDQSVQLPETVRELGRLYIEQVEAFDARIRDLDQKMRAATGQAAMSRRLQTMPGVGAGTRFRRLAGARAAPVLHRRQAAPRKDVEDGSTRHSQTSDCRRVGGDTSGFAQQSAGRFVVGAHAGEKAADGCRRRSREQDGPRDMGHDDEGGGLPEPGRGQVSATRISSRPGMSGV